MRTALAAVVVLANGWIPGVTGNAAEAGGPDSMRASLMRASRRERRDKDWRIAIAKGGAAQMAIVAPNGAPAPVRFAARELKSCLDRIAGAEFRIVESVPAQGGAFVLGDCPAARRAGIDVSRLARDGYAVECVGQSVYVAGRDDDTKKSEILFELQGEKLYERLPRADLYGALSVSSWDFDRGTLYGVYRVLEELGVRWFFPGPKGEVVPSRPDLSMQAFSLLEEPHYALRHVGTDRWVLSRVSRAKFPHVDPNEYRDLQWSGRSNRLWLLRLRGSSPWFAFNHRPPRTRWEQRFGEAHPEYFALLPTGRRDLPPASHRTGHLCYTHPEVFEQTRLDVEAFFDGKAAGARGIPERYHAPDNRGWGIAACYGDSVSMLPHDSFRPCQCPDCKPRQRPAAERWEKNSALVWPFVVKVAEAAELRFPEKLVFCLAYSSYTEIPADLKRLPDNVVVGLCPHIGPRKHNKTYNLTTPEARARVVELATRWRGMNRLPLLGWFHHLYGYSTQRCGVPMLIPHSLAALCRDLVPHARLMLVEFDPDFIILEHLNRYVLQRVLYDPNEDVDAILDDYCASFYGPAADVIRPVLADVEARSEEVARTGAGRIRIWEECFPESALQGYRRAADRAVELTRDTPHAVAADVFSRHFVGVMERGFQLYVTELRDMADSPAACVASRRIAEPIAVDGKLAEPAWQAPAASNRFLSNATGKPIAWNAELRILHDSDNLYVAFTCHDPKTPERSIAEGAADYVEIFLDPDHNHRDYYWLMVDAAGRVTDIRFPGAAAKPDQGWQSGAQAAATRRADRWHLEISLPLRAVGNASLQGKWGANFCRTLHVPPKRVDRFSSTSPLMRGAFHQPDLFGHLTFGE